MFGARGSEALEGVRVSAITPDSSQFVGNQTESAIAVANFEGKTTVSIAFNDDGGREVRYTDTDRIVGRGASQFGWSYSADRGRSFVYGGKVPATDEWPVMWGDPAIASLHPDERYVFMSNLAVPASKMPASGEIVGGFDGRVLGGACIAKSSDGGRSFALWHCVHQNNDFYDGGTAVAGSDANGGTDRRIFFGFIDITLLEIHVWQADNENVGELRKLPNPFAGNPMSSHPRLRIDRATGDLYAAALSSEKRVLVSRWSAGSWSTPRIASGSTTTEIQTIPFASSKMRTAPEFTFDVGPATDSESSDAVRVFTTRLRANGTHFVEGWACPRGLGGGCRATPGWSTESSTSDQFQPAVTAFQGLPFLGVPGRWELTYLTRAGDAGGDRVSVDRTGLGGDATSGRYIVPTQIVSLGYVCPDTRGGSSLGGYWGDYNDMALLEVQSGKVPRFLRTFTTSDRSDFIEGCYSQQSFFSTHVHLKAIRL